MTLVYLILAMVVIPLLVLVFLIGLIFLILGLVNKRKPKYAGRKFPVVFISVGVTLLMLPVVTAVVGIGTHIGTFFYSSVPEHWQHAWVSDHRAAEEAIEALMEAAGQGDREGLAKTFTAEVRNSPAFEAELDNFLRSYPSALSDCKRDGGVSGSGGSYNYGHNVLSGSAEYTCELEGEKFFISLSFCYENTDEPDKVGVEYFSVMNLRARALYIQESNERSMRGEKEDNTVLICDLKSSSEVDARLIGGYPFVWHTTDTEKLTEDDMRTLLSQAETMEELYEKIGFPNVSIKYSHSTGYDYYYELVPENGEPRYAHICASTAKGRIIDAYVFTPEKGLYKNPLKAFQKQNES